MTNDTLRSKRHGPDLQDLVARHGGYEKITPEAWAQWDMDCEEWRAAMRAGRYPSPREDQP